MHAPYQEVIAMDFAALYQSKLTTPEEAITPRKFASLRRAAEAYMTQHRVRLEPQFDLAAVDLFPDGSMNVRFTERAMECNW